jgi:hypothetical protein
MAHLVFVITVAVCLDYLNFYFVFIPAAPQMTFIKLFWEATFRCTHRNSIVAEGVWLCSGNESLTGLEYPFQEVSKFDITYTAVYSIAHALHNLIACEHRDGMCEDPLAFQPWQGREKCEGDSSRIDNRTLSLTYRGGVFGKDVLCF